MKFNFENFKKGVQKVAMGTGALAITAGAVEQAQSQTTPQNQNPSQTGRYARDARGDTTLITRADSVVVAESYLKMVDILLQNGYMKFEDGKEGKVCFPKNRWQNINGHYFLSSSDLSNRTVNNDLRYQNLKQYSDTNIRPIGLSHYILKKISGQKNPLIITDPAIYGKNIHPEEMSAQPHTTDIYTIHNYQNVVDELKRTEPKPQHPIENIPRMAKSPFTKFKPKTSDASLMKIKGTPVETKKDNGRIFFRYSPGGKNNYINWGDGRGPQILTNEEADALYEKLRKSGIMKILAETGQSNYNGDYVPKARIPEEMKDDKNYFAPEFYEKGEDQVTGN